MMGGLKLRQGQVCAVGSVCAVKEMTLPLKVSSKEVRQPNLCLLDVLVYRRLVCNQERLHICAIEIQCTLCFWMPQIQDEEHFGLVV